MAGGALTAGGRGRGGGRVRQGPRKLASGSASAWLAAGRAINYECVTSVPDRFVGERVGLAGDGEEVGLITSVREQPQTASTEEWNQRGSKS